MIQGKKFSADFAQATDVNAQTRVLVQTPENPVQYAELGQFKEVVNEGMVSEDSLSETLADYDTAEQTKEKIDETLEGYAKQDGNYPKMSVGFAENVVGDGTATEEEFSFRPTAGVNRNVGTTTYDYDMRSNFGARIASVKGNSMVWNQLVDTNTTSLTLAATRKYYTNIGGTISIQSPNSATTISVNGSTDKVTDLTQMFGAGNEPTTVEEFYSLLPKNVDLNAYNDGEIVDAHYEAIKTTGFNQWDEQCRIGAYNNSGVFVTNDAQLLCNANPIRIIPNATYWRGGSASYTMVCYWYDASMNFLTITYVSPNRKIAPPSNSAWMNFRMQQEYGTTYKNDICINIAWDEYSAMNGTYAPYKPFERDLSWVSQYFPNGMRRAGSASDEIRFNSTTQKWEAVQRVGVRAYTSGDEGDTTLTTDGTNTNYPLAIPIVTEIEDSPNLDYDVADYGTEELIVAEGVKSAPFHADIIYTPNALKTLEQVPDILRRLAALENATTTTE